ncbi:ATP-binding cassette domain-containing protein [Clostridium botulinum]|uniref:ATP-binding cassette domain-containing protein n=1 Tax=Clostridium botulinum TaxID=1491 RepID=UPI0013F12281|nr:ATP-binding cassette domain-containing protein [Clostridium botulinum]MBN1048051.1 ATP-binding cassette domain-containing protein [Clostridium botulinum]MBN1057901.1 ATP-binding cassette domain-containing protein [Clostridium botulinum]MBN1061146.1 ATP-binding cassette domain-containing protein [Clostridium botulinum]MBY6933006.1 ATP-binding cassette domain-containing protein [Clostridium botulinum]NFH88661.1 ATP-binding cassette domain-containing protein [Clostridium botulinum]
MNNKLSVENINFSYDKKKVLNNISFSCDNGITSILGPNGAGKTTLMKIFIGANKPSMGKVILNNENIVCYSNNNNIMGYLPQNFDIYDNITGYDFLSYVCDIKNVNSTKKKQHVEQVVQQFNLENFISKKIGSYSGGYKRRLGIAQAVIGDPNIVIIDEPTVGLDPEQRLEFRHYLSEIGKERIVLISTHILEDVELYTNNILILNQGSLIFNGNTNEAIVHAKNNIYTTNVNVDELALINKKVMVIEEKRLENNMIKIKFIKNGDIMDKSELEKEVSLENAYVFFQKCKTSL